MSQDHRENGTVNRDVPEIELIMKVNNTYFGRNMKIIPIHLSNGGWEFSAKYKTGSLLFKNIPWYKYNYLIDTTRIILMTKYHIGISKGYLNVIKL